MKPIQLRASTDQGPTHTPLSTLLGGGVEGQERASHLVRCREAIERALMTGNMNTVSQVMGDVEAPGHVQRVGRMAELLARLLGLPEDEVTCIGLAAPLHDFGKLGVPSALLRKPGSLEPEEFAIVKRHALIGCVVLSHSKNPILRLAGTISRTHHERYDGGGYPYGLRDDEIPIAGRIVALVDVFDALLSVRPYKPAFSLERTMALMRGDVGSHFDPAIFARFEANLGRFLTLRSGA